MNKKKFLLLCTLALAGVSSARAEEQKNPYQKGNYLYFIGEGQPDPSMTNKTQRRATAKNAATVNAQARMAFYMDNIRTEGGSVIKEARAKDGKVQQKIDAYLRGFKTVKTKWDGQDNCAIILRIHKKNLFRDLKAQGDPPGF